MSQFEDPIQFDINKKVGDVEIAYSDLMEISQGGPEVGNLSINGKTIEGRYGGPAICKDEYVYAPIYVKKFLGTGFKLARINIATFEVEHLSKTKDLIFLDKVEGGRLYFFEDMSKTIQRHYEL
jgi:hypothetical protein